MGQVPRALDLVVSVLVIVARVGRLGLGVGWPRMSRAHLGSLALVTLISACGDNTEVLRIGPGTTTMVAVQDGDGPWQLEAAGPSGHIEVPVTSDHFGVAYLCEYGSTRFTHVSWFTSREPFSLDCGVAYSVSISGATAPGTAVALGNLTVEANVNGTYNQVARAGRNDVIAVLPGTPSRALFVRDVEIDEPMTLDLPIGADGVDLTAMTPTVLGATEPVSIYADINTLNGTYAVFGRDPSTVSVPPLDALVASDRASIGATSGECSSQRALGATAPTLRIPSPLSVSLDHASLSASWDADDAIAWDDAWFVLEDPMQTARGDISIGATRDWLDITGKGQTLNIPPIPWLPPALFAAGDEVSLVFQIRRGVFFGDYEECTHREQLTW